MSTGVYRTRDNRFEFVSGFVYGDGFSSNSRCWHIYEVGDNEPFLDDREPTLADAVATIEAHLAWEAKK